MCEPDNTTPNYLVEKLQNIAANQAATHEKLEAIVTQTTRTNGQVAETVRDIAQQGRRITRLEDSQKVRNKWGGRAWNVIKGAGLIAFGVWVKS